MLNSGLDGEAGQFSSEKHPYEDIEQISFYITAVRAQTIVVQRYIERLEGNQSAVGQLPCTPGPSLDAVTSINSENTPVKLYGNINIDKQKLRQATVTGRMKTQNPVRCLNATVSVLLSGWWTKSELSLFSLAGRAFPSIPGSKPKAKFPEEVMEAIVKFSIPKRESWHKVLLTADQIKTAIGDRLLACHTSKKKIKLQEAAALNVAGKKDSLSLRNSDLQIENCNNVPYNGSEE
ncbi:hypothetical protein OUZ56_018392 [Daphnia magna]|uniref:BEN domain-containing protein n=1 Tax=Daphnia magna TaxID=35525 RepID=A0ABQ9Z8R6_9CRUS|nr:hypothetical protein OUZ56_018392 [Daphnia magna]